MLVRWFSEFVIILMTVKVNIDTDFLKTEGPYENKTAVHYTSFSIIACFVLIRFDSTFLPTLFHFFNRVYLDTEI